MPCSLKTPACLATALVKIGVTAQFRSKREKAKGNIGRSARPLRLAVAAVGLVWSTHAGAQAIKEYPIPTPNSSPAGIAAGSDGALWFTENAVTSVGAPPGPGKVGRITTAGAITEFLIPTPASVPTDIAAGPDGALWFLEANKIGRITTSGTITEYPIPTPNSASSGISVGPDGALWFAYGNGNKIGRITTSGVISEFPIPELQSRTLGSPVAGPDGAMWFTDTAILPVNLPGTQPSKIGRITTSGMVAEYAIPTLSFLNAIAVGQDGALWFTEEAGQTDKIGRITTSGGAVTQYVTEYPTPTSQSDPVGIAAGADGALWFTEFGVRKIGRITTSGNITEYPLPPPALPFGITAGPDGALWFTNPGTNSIGRITTPPSGSPLVAAVLPSSRSVEVGNTATAFATIINSGSTTASGCAIVPVTSVPASFVYQTTNPATNALTGSPNTPVSIAAGAAQSFVIALTPNAPVVPTEVALGFDCAGVNAATSNTGLNTLLLSGSATPVPDIVALAATAQNDGILHITGTSGSNAFAVATVNVGASASITATASTGAATLPLAISLCQTNPMSGQCISSIGPSVTTTINANATPTFAIFATASASVPFVPQTNRIFVAFSDASGTVRGSTSVAVQTQ